MKKFDISGLSLRNLRLLVDIYETGTVSDGAKQNGVSQSSASHSLDRIREQLGDPLFMRVGRSIAPTDFMHDILPDVKRILVELEAVLSGANFHVGPNTQPIAIASNTTEMLPALKRIEKRIRADVPDIRIRFVDLGSRENTFSLLESGKVDLVFLPSLASYPVELNAEALYRDTIVCFLDKQFFKKDLSLSDYVNATHATLDFGGAKPSIVDMALDSMNVSRSIKLSAANSMVLSDLMQGTPHIATLPRFLSETAFRDFAWSPVPFNVPTLAYDMVWHRRVGHTNRHVWLLDIVRSVFDLYSPDSAADGQIKDPFQV